MSWHFGFGTGIGCLATSLCGAQPGPWGCQDDHFPRPSLVLGALPLPGSSRENRWTKKLALK